MKAETFQRRIETRLFTKSGKLKEKYFPVVDKLVYLAYDTTDLRHIGYKNPNDEYSKKLVNSIKEGLKLLGLSLDRRVKEPYFVQFSKASMDAIMPWVDWVSEGNNRRFAYSSKGKLTNKGYKSIKEYI